MRRAILIFAWMVWLAGPAARHANAQAPASAGGAQTVDGVAARIEDDILTESEVRELGAFQQLVDGRAKARDERIRELADQWILRGEAETAKYPQPSSDDVSRAYAQLAAQFTSPEEFQRRCTAAGLTETAVRRMLGQQLYLSRFIDYRFRPAAQVDQKQIETYYTAEFAPQLKSRGQPVPPLETVEDTIREVLIQREISGRATQWLDETRERLKIDVMSPGDRP
ncbi:MAG TPA: hypothetical protein VN822_01445 [Candidatus Acidoferrales bacterium]|nr:hypothetical protein [Candidatus Acidoferrales bacterium]